MVPPQLSVISYQLSVISYQLSVVSGQLSVVGGQYPAVSFCCRASTHTNAKTINAFTCVRRKKY
jgi:hypothetical protein